MVHESNSGLILKGMAERKTTMVAIDDMLQEAASGSPLPEKVQQASQDILSLLLRRTAEGDPIDWSASVELQGYHAKVATQALLGLTNKNNWYGDQANYMFRVAEEGELPLVKALAPGELMQGQVPGQLSLFNDIE